MADAILSNPIFHDEDAAREHFESLRWPNGRECPHCGVIEDSVPVAQDEERAAKRKKAGKKIARKGLYFCRSCQGQFTATMGTVYEDSHIPLNKWMLATHLMNSSKKGRSALQLQRELGLGSYRTAWFMAMRIRASMPTGAEPMGGEGKIVEADETYFGDKQEPTGPKLPRRTPYTKGGRSGPANKRAVVALVERGGEVRTFHVARADKETVAKIITDNVHPASRLHTDESALYRGADAHTATHETTKHSAGEYVRGDVHSNSVEGFFGTFKTGMIGVYHHCDEKYLAMYLREYESRYNHRTKLGFNDVERAALSVQGTVGKRLTLRPLKGIEA